MSFLRRLLGISPFFELMIRKAYYSEFGIINKFAHKVNDKTKTTSIKISDSHVSHESTIFDYIKNLGIQKGDILIVHTSEDNLKSVGIGPKQLFSFLRSVVGENGTLVFPTYPLYNEKNYDSNLGMYVYNPKGTLCDTGMIPNLFLRQPKVERSLYPWNSLAAQGPEAKEMMTHNLENDLSYGKGSAWEYCYKRKAKILLLGVKASHTTSMVHTAEDLMDDEWPINDWYECKTIYIDSESIKKPFTVRLRKPEWAKYNASWYRSNQLITKKILVENSVCGLNIAYISNSKEMVDYIIERNKRHKGFFVVPKKYYKKK